MVRVRSRSLCINCRSWWTSQRRGSRLTKMQLGRAIAPQSIRMTAFPWRRQVQQSHRISRLNSWRPLEPLSQASFNSGAVGWRRSSSLRLMPNFTRPSTQSFSHLASLGNRTCSAGLIWTLSHPQLRRVKEWESTTSPITFVKTISLAICFGGSLSPLKCVQLERLNASVNMPWSSATLQYSQWLV